MTSDTIASVERTLGRIEQQLVDVRRTMPDHDRKLDMLDDRIERSERAMADRHKENREVLAYLTATCDANKDALSKLEERITALEKPILAWKTWRRRLYGGVVAVAGLTWMVGEPFYRAVLEPITRAVSQRILGGWLH